MAIVIFLALLVISWGQSCPPNCMLCTSNGMTCMQCAAGYYLGEDNTNCYECVSPNCNQNSCVFFAPGVYGCSSCANNSYVTPFTSNGYDQSIDGNLVGACQLCSAEGSNCLTCTYDPQLPSNMSCQSCNEGFGVSLEIGSNYGTCQPCQSYCLSCQYNEGPSSGCGANISFASCGTNGMMCNQCTENYTLGIDANCYYCPMVSNYCLANSCAEVALGVFSCSACASNAYILFYNVDGSNIGGCQLCSTANTGCLACQYAPTLTYGIYCSSCEAGYGIPYGIWGCTVCPINCLACNAQTTGMGSACGVGVSSASCGTNGLVCSQCATGYTLGTVDLNCYYCPNVSTNCLVNSCNQVALGVFSCSACATGTFNLPMSKNGINYTICQLCSVEVSYCSNCAFSSRSSSGIQCYDCISGYGVSNKQGDQDDTCQPCGSNCQQCWYPQGSYNNCGPNIQLSACGTNNFVCDICATNYILGVDDNCYYCPTVSPNCNVNSCYSVSLGVFSCNQCSNNNSFLVSSLVNGTSVGSCLLCSSVDLNCVLCLANAAQSTGMTCISCLVGYAPNYWATPNSICQPCGSNCLSCQPQQQTSGCASNGTCGTNGLLCNECSEGYVLLSDANCYSCPTVSPNCQSNSCFQASTGIITCTQCSNNAFSIPMTINGTMQVADGSTAYSCQLCSTEDPNCLTCTYNAGQSTNMVCTQCNTGFALNYWAVVPSTCQACGSDCLTCLFVPFGTVNCTSCSNNSFILPLMDNATNLTVNGNQVWTCQLCSAASSNCLTCTYDPQMSSNMFCSQCEYGFAVVVIGSNYSNQGSCQPCSFNCLSCQQITGNGCGDNVSLSNCGTDGLMCNQCAGGYILAPNANCYTCPTLSPGCIPNSCSEVAFGVVTCDQCANNAAMTPVMINGTEQVINGNTVYNCFICSKADKNCMTCIYDPNQSLGIICTSCVSGYVPNYWENTVGICQRCGSNCLACIPYQQTNGCGANVSSSSCGTNGLMCTKCAASYILSSDANCDSCSKVSPNCNLNSCSQVAEGLYNCSLCDNNAFSVPMMVNGTAELVNGASVYSCQLCSAQDSNCLTCAYYSGQSTNMMCTSCVAGYTPNYYATPIGICQQCGSNCLQCQPEQQVGGCSGNFTQANCGTNGLMCIQCAAGYTLQGDANCYFGSSVELESGLGEDQTNWLLVGLSVLIGLIGVVAIVMVISCIRNRSAKGETKQKLLSSQIEIGNLNQ